MNSDSPASLRLFCQLITLYFEGKPVRTSVDPPPLGDCLDRADTADDMGQLFTSYGSSKAQ